MYKYSISGNTWGTAVVPIAARAGAPTAGMGAGCFGLTGEPSWADESNIKNGRYIYSLRGGATNAIDRYDIAGNTWSAIVYQNGETFTTGSSSFIMGRYMFVRKDATNRFFKYSIRGNYMEPISTNFYPESTAVVGSKIWVKSYDAAGTIQWLYSLGNTTTTLHRLMLI